jgi:acyl-CoA synthetase (AMP-forming)/AMP-acid ligase II
MKGLMMDTPLLITSLIRFAAEYHGDTEIVSRTLEGPLHRYTYSDAYQRIQKLANALHKFGVRPGDRVATLAWNGYRHFELYYAISSMGAVCHTINPRLFHEQIDYIVNHADDRVIFIDLPFVELVEELQKKLTTVEAYVVMTDAAHMPETTLKEAVDYESFIADETDSYDWPMLDENAAASLCYTSGTTGNPKGVLFSHRSTVLHSFSICHADATLALSSSTTVLPVVPMFHVHAWGIPYGAVMSGSKLVFAGAKLDGKSLYELFESERVTITAGVPTVWLGLIEYMKSSGKKFSHLDSIVIGGSAAPLSMIKDLEEGFGVSVMQAWGMTEISPIGTNGRLKGKYQNLPADERHVIKTAQGRAKFGVDLKIVDDEGRYLPHDGTTSGELLVHGPWVAQAYFKDEEASKLSHDNEGWMRTGDVGTIDADGHLRLIDRTKDLIKSGGEWISSIELENAATGHPAVAEAAAIAVAHPKWTERPLLFVVPLGEAELDGEEIMEFLKDKVAKWWLPDDIIFVGALPHTATGKIHKLRLREQYRDYKLPTA